jgi:hypothetical protein
VKDHTGTYYDLNCAFEELEVPEEFDPHFSLQVSQQLPFVPHPISQQIILSMEHEIDFHKPYSFCTFSLTPINTI